MALYRDISTGVEQEFDFDPSGRNVYSKFQPIEYAGGPSLHGPSIVAEAANRLQNAPLPIPAANNTPPLGGAGSVNINIPSGDQGASGTSGAGGAAQSTDWGSILAMFAGANQPQQPTTPPTAMTPSPLQGGSSFRISTPETHGGQSGIWMNIPPGTSHRTPQNWAIAGAGPYRQKIQQQLLSRGYTPQEVETILADFDATPQGQLELGPQAAAPAMATGAGQDLNNMLMGLLTGTQNAGAGDASMWSAFGDLFSGAPTSQAGAAPGGGFGDLFQGNLGLFDLGGTGTSIGADAGSQSFDNFFQGLDTGVAGAGGFDFSKTNIESMAKAFGSTFEVDAPELVGAATDMGRMMAQFMANETDANAADIDIAGMIGTGGQVEEFLTQLGLPTWQEIKRGWINPGRPSRSIRDFRSDQT